MDVVYIKLCEKCEVGYFLDENGGCSYSDNCEEKLDATCGECVEGYY